MLTATDGMRSYAFTDKDGHPQLTVCFLDNHRIVVVCKTPAFPDGVALLFERKHVRCLPEELTLARDSFTVAFLYDRPDRMAAAVSSPQGSQHYLYWNLGDKGHPNLVREIFSHLTGGFDLAL